MNFVRGVGRGGGVFWGREKIHLIKLYRARYDTFFSFSSFWENFLHSLDGENVKRHFRTNSEKKMEVKRANHRWRRTG